MKWSKYGPIGTISYFIVLMNEQAHWLTWQKVVKAAQKTSNGSKTLT